MASPGFLVPKSQKGPHSHTSSRQQEKTAVARIGGRATARSGAGVEKGDARKVGFCRVECKTTTHASFRVTRSDIEKLEGHSLGSNEMPFYVVRLEGPPALEVVVMPSYALDIIRDRMEAKDASP